MPLSGQTILVTGGAGFIGSHVNEMLYRHGYKTIVLDNLSQGHAKAVLHGIFIKGEIDDENLLDSIFRTYSIDAVMHFAAAIDVGESMLDPLKYYANNVITTIKLLKAMENHKVKTFVFSSTAAIFGKVQEEEISISEDYPCNPINPYGKSKLIIENILPDLDRAYGLRFCCLRYFNVAGGDPQGILKNYKTNVSNLIPLVLRKLQQNSAITIFGNDYDTPDGTAIRDYIHVMDIAAAHIAAMEKLFAGSASCCYNLGNGKGYSVKEVIDAAEKVTGLPAHVVVGPRRPGDPTVIIADSTKAQKELAWLPKYFSLKTMIEHARNAKF